MADFRPRSNSELLDAGFEIYRRHFVLLMAISVFTALPVAVASYVSDAAITTGSITAIYNSLLIRSVGLLISPFATGSVAVVASSAYLGRMVDLGQVIRTVFLHPLRLFCAMLCVWLLIGLGLLLLLFPAVIVYKRYFAVIMVVLFEDRGIKDSMKRSRELSTGDGKRILGLSSAVFLFAMIVSMFLGGAATVLHGMSREVAILIAYMVMAPFFPIATTLLYYDLRVRKEGYDIELMTQELDASPLVPQPTA